MFHRRFILAPLAVGAILVSVAAAGAHPLNLPSSGNSQIAKGTRLEGNYVWDLTLGNGMRTHWETEGDVRGALQAGQSDWTQDGKSLGTRRVEMVSSRIGVRATIQRTDAESQAAYDIQRNMPEFDALSEKYNALLDRITAECGKLPENSQAACSRKYEPQVDAMQKQMYAQEDAAKHKASMVSAVCTRLDLRVRDGKVSGTATECPSGSEVTVSGTYQATGGK